jgi:hypothetical protein
LLSSKGFVDARRRRRHPARDRIDPARDAAPSRRIARSMDQLRSSHGLADLAAAMRAFIDYIDLLAAPMRLNQPSMHRK